MASFIRSIRRLLPMPTISSYNDLRIAETVYAKTQRYVPTKYSPIAGERFVLDFGGGCGVHYVESQARYSRWAIVETITMVNKARSYHRPRNVEWFEDIASAVAWLGSTPELIICNGALQYCVNTHAILYDLCSLKADTIVWRRTNLSNHTPYVQHSFLSDHGPGVAIGPEAHVLTWVYPMQLEVFLDAHWEYEGKETNDEWIFRRKA